MPRYSHLLEVKFNISDETQYYSGKSFYKKNIIDYVEVSADRIALSFDRSKKLNVADAFHSTNSIIRYELQRALCFYLVVHGTIPDVESVIYNCEGKTEAIEHEGFTNTWKNCNISITLPPESAKVIFESEKGMPFYVIITHFLKAQLDLFFHDRFRAAWSALNALYTYIDSVEKPKTDGKKNNREFKKIATLDEMLLKNRMAFAMEAVNHLEDESFWKRLNWYQVLSELRPDRFKKICNEKYTDAELLGYYYHYRSIFNGKQQEKHTEAEWSGVVRIIQNGQKTPIDRLRFLTCNYCYLLRNKSMHAERPYPLFIISDDVETRIEKKLTEIILLTIKDLFILYSGKIEY